MVYRRRVRLCCGTLTTGLLLAGSSGAGGGEATEPPGSKTATASSGTRSSPAPSPSATGLGFTPDPGRAPKTRAEAERLTRAVAAAPVNWGPGFVKRDPYESDPGF